MTTQRILGTPKRWYQAAHDKLLDVTVGFVGHDGNAQIFVDKDDVVRLTSVRYYGNDSFRIDGVEPHERHALDVFLPTALGHSFLNDLPKELGSAVVHVNNNQESNTVIEPVSINWDTIKINRGGSELRPVVIFVHGGGWDCGSKKYWFDTFGAMGWDFARANMIGIVCNYRLSPEFKHPCHVTDVALVARWIKNNIERFGGDPNLVFIAGHSSGGHTVLLLETDSQYLEKVGASTDWNNNNFLKGVIGMSGSYDIEWIHSLPLPQCKIVINQAFGKDKNQWPLANPQYVAEHLPAGIKLPPTFLLNAQWDYGMQKHSERLRRALTSNHKRCAILTKEYQGVNHINIMAGGLTTGCSAGTPYPPMIEDMITFVDSIVKGLKTEKSNIDLTILDTENAPQHDEAVPEHERLDDFTEDVVL